jgi:hypothetical protein
MLYVRYIHLTKAKPIHERQTHPHVREEVTYEIWQQGFSCKKKSLVVILKGLGSETKWLAVNRP